jgi:hypothetical protein
VLRHVVRLVAAVLVTSAAGLGLSAPAQAATCDTASGVSVVVDFHQLGGVQTACDSGGAGKYAATQFTEVGHTLTYVQGEAFVCQVDGAPDTQCVRTPPATAYWSLWWSDGKSGTWTYASTGVGSLKVPDGGYIALSWQKGSAQVPPGVAPKSHSASSPTSSPTSQAPPSPTPTQHHGPSGGAGSPSSAPSPSSPTATSSGSQSPSDASASAHPARHHARKSPSTSPSATPTASQTDVPTAEAAEPLTSTAADSDSGLPGWVAPVLVGALFVAAGAVAFVRRKRAGGP